ncbi:hypothetical protein Moror_12386 [Moniliophthora roreri MCA 2997]|uniref:F-box domain-containing protein n=2 Tax=Moniliophthora roreri TaxID=221103 RepID=V2YVR0_MONRO|nr:hypothetical protein Moror_12386 [Moniliophthora roreri MCA 2997]KAI3616223.1 hypothetical protein WG66_013981 [Moniliophthora roreri]
MAPSVTMERGKPALPLDIIDTLLFHCKYDKETRQSCSLVCRSWLPFSRFHFFNHRAISVPNRREATRLCEVLYSPLCTLIPFIRTLKIFVDPAGDHHLWIIEALRLLVERSVSLTKLIAICRGLKDLQDTTYFSLLRALVGESMLSLDLLWISPVGSSFLPIATAPVKKMFFLSGPRLKHLSLDAGISWLGDEEVELASNRDCEGHPPPETHELSTLSITMHCMSFTLDWLSKAFVFPSLTHLYLRCEDRCDGDSLQRFLDTSARSIRHLFLDCGLLSELNGLPYIDLSHLASLRSLHISFPDHRAFIKSLIDIVSSTAFRLTSIVLLSVFTEGQPIEIFLGAWKALDILLVEQSNLKQLVLRPQLQPFFDACQERGILVNAEGKYPLKRRWRAACARVYGSTEY